MAVERSRSRCQTIVDCLRSSLVFNGRPFMLMAPESVPPETLQARIFNCGQDHEREFRLLGFAVWWQSIHSPVPPTLHRRQGQPQEEVGHLATPEVRT